MSEILFVLCLIYTFLGLRFYLFKERRHNCEFCTAPFSFKLADSELKKA